MKCLQLERSRVQLKKRPQITFRCLFYYLQVFLRTELLVLLTRCRVLIGTWQYLPSSVWTLGRMRGSEINMAEEFISSLSFQASSGLWKCHRSREARDGIGGKGCGEKRKHGCCYLKSSHS